MSFDEVMTLIFLVVVVLPALVGFLVGAYQALFRDH